MSRPARPPGRPLMGREKRRRYVVTLEPATAETARQIGAGNLSAGLTAAVERFDDRRLGAVALFRMAGEAHANSLPCA